jgi:hypothetical protein
MKSNLNPLIYSMRPMTRMVLQKRYRKSLGATKQKREGRKMTRERPIQALFSLSCCSMKNILNSVIHKG